MSNSSSEHKNNHEPLLVMDNVSLSLADKPILHNISFDGYPGEIIALLGPNGAGKTTTMRLLTGNLAPDKGSIMVCGESPRGKPDYAASQLGYLPEGAPLWMNRTVIDILLFTASCHRLTGQSRDKRVTMIIDLLKLEQTLDQVPEHLSKGLRRRVALAIALLPDPPVLILDEPSDGLDPAQQRVLHQALKDLAVTKTILISTHNLDEVQTLCKKIIILNQGRIAATYTGQKRDALFETPDGMINTFLELTVSEDSPFSTGRPRA